MWKEAVVSTEELNVHTFKRHYSGLSLVCALDLWEGFGEHPLLWFHPDDISLHALKLLYDRNQSTVSGSIGFLT